jgi:hypothetical protein
MELRPLNRSRNHSAATNEPEPGTPKIPPPYLASVELWDDPAPDTYRTQIRQQAYVKSAFIVSYVLASAAVISTVVTIIALILSRHDARTASIFPQSFPLLTATCDSRKLQFNNLFAHLFVNSIGTVILGMSNYVQQMCASPTVEEIAEGFRRRGDVYFGSNSPSAVFRLRQRSLAVAWVALTVTSLPLHLTLNGITGFAAKAVEADRVALTLSQIDQLNPLSLTWSNTSAGDCAALLISSRAHVTDFNNITIFIKNDLPPNAVAYYNGSGESYYADPSDIWYCYVNLITSQCQLTVRWFPLLCTSIAIIAKALIVFFLVRRHPHFHQPQFSTLGDMIVLGSRHPELRQFLPGNPPARGTDLGPKPYHQMKIPWRRALGPADFAVALFWWSTAISVTTLGTYCWYHVVAGISMSDRFKRFGLGTEDPATSIVSGTTGQPFQEGLPFAVQVITANLPQVWSTIGYLTWNNQITRIWLEKEWRSFYQGHRLPRVSFDIDDQGMQQARWLQLPYWVTGVLMSVSILLHWLVSQTLFVVEIYFTDASVASVFHLHYSPLAIIMVGSIASVLVFGITVYYFIPIKTWMPLMAGSTKIVLDSCVGLPRRGFPRAGIGWGDISKGNNRMAGFGPITVRMVEGVHYPGLISEEFGYMFDYQYASDFDHDPLFRRA